MKASQQKRRLRQSPALDAGQFVRQISRERKSERFAWLSDIMATSMALARESHGTQNLKIAASTLKELRYSFNMFFPHRFSKKITIFGSARVAEGSPLYNFAKKFATLATKKGYGIITGGGPGIMAAGNEGAHKTGFGLNIRLPSENIANAHIDPGQRLLTYKYFFTRKLFLVKEASAGVFFPGGFGTFDEAFEMLTLLQTGKTSPLPIIFIEPSGYGFWKEFTKLVAAMEHAGFVNPTDRNLYAMVNSPRAALNIINRFYSNFHSLRVVNGQTVLRIKNRLPPGQVKKLTKKFKHIFQDELLTQRGALPEEKNEPELKKLVRLVFTFKKFSHGSLRRLIDAVNLPPRS